MSKTDANSVNVRRNLSMALNGRRQCSRRRRPDTLVVYGKREPADLEAAQVSHQERIDAHPVKRRDIASENGRPCRLATNQCGRGSDPVMVVSNGRPFDTVNIDGSVGCKQSRSSCPGVASTKPAHPLAGKRVLLQPQGCPNMPVFASCVSLGDWFAASLAECSAEQLPR